MSGFASQQFADDGAVTVSSTEPSIFQTTVNSFDSTTKYLVLVDGLARCPAATGVLAFDVLFNNDKVLNTRNIQTATNIGTTPLSVNWPVQCTNCTQTTADDGTMIFSNTLALKFTWIPPSGTDPSTIAVPPTVESLSVSLIAVA